MVLAFVWIAGCNSGQKSPPASSREAPKPAAAPAPSAPKGTPHAVLETDKGRIVIRLWPDLAPKSVDNFTKLTQSGFYIRTSFHRVMAGMMIQGGDPNSKDNDPYNDGQGNSGSYIPAEFSSRKFQRGVVAMARHEGDPNSASCQFFIVLKRVPHWDGQYTAFGEVAEGIETADAISKSPLSKDPRLKNWPVGSCRIRRATIEYR
jgi:peptidyl-prolyl cis-trans isomerase B (cyclophilin B)